eukprot:COSAG01_NODE_2738_length_7160_cov_14.104943_2_plen_113_part_00
MSSQHGSGAAATLWHRGTVVSLSSSFDGSLTFATEAETHVIRGAEHVFPAEATWSCSDSRAAVVIVRCAAAQPAANTGCARRHADDGVGRGLPALARRATTASATFYPSGGC